MTVGLPFALAIVVTTAWLAYVAVRSAVTSRNALDGTLATVLLAYIAYGMIEAVQTSCYTAYITFGPVAGLTLSTRGEPTNDIRLRVGEKQGSVRTPRAWGPAAGRQDRLPRLRR